MHNLTKRLLVVTLLVSSMNLQTNASAGINLSGSFKSMPSWAKGVAVAGGVIIAAAIGKLAYNKFFKLSDAQEITHALTQCNEITFSNNEIICRYNNECSSLIAAGNMASAHKYATILYAVKYSIYAKYNYLPFYKYVQSLDKTIAQLSSRQDQLCQISITLFERKAALNSRIHNATLENDFLATMDGYENALEVAAQKYEETQELHYTLQEIRNAVIQSAEYALDCKQARIDELEREKEWHAYKDDEFTSHKPAIHAHITHVTHNIHTTPLTQETTPVAQPTVVKPQVAATQAAEPAPKITTSKTDLAWYENESTEFGHGGDAWWGA